MGKAKLKKVPVPAPARKAKPARATDPLEPQGAPPPSDLASHVPRLSKYQKFTPARVARGELKNAPYNPRVIDKHARKRLTAQLKKMGLVDALVWNKRTGNLVGRM